MTDHYKQPLSCVIVEDEAVAARRLKKMLQNNGIQSVAELHSVKESVAWFTRNPSPDLIFLDIQLGDGISFEIFEQVEPESAIIFTTAYDEYALRAFKFNSIDYLLKPIQEKELQKALEKFRQMQPQQFSFSHTQLQQLLQANFESRYRERFLVKIGQKLKTIETKDVALFYSENKGTYILNDGRSYLIENSLEELEEQLDPDQFFRISRQAIVNLSFIAEIVSHSGSRLLLSMKNSADKWTVSREKVQDFKLWLAK